MIEINILDFIPQEFRELVRNALVDFVSEQAKKYLNDQASEQIKKLRTDAVFNRQLNQGLQKAIQRFVEEYELQDEDLVKAIVDDPTFFKRRPIQNALLTVLKQPSASLVDERITLIQSFEDILPERKNRERVEKAITYLLKCLAEELWHLPEIQPIYSLQFQRTTAEASLQQVDILKAQLNALNELSEINSGVREILLQLIDVIATHQKLLPPGDKTGINERPKVYHNLPQPNYGRFVGREEAIAKIYRILRPYPNSQEHLITIDGIGGIGKSALALEVAYRYLHNYDHIPEDERFEAIVWTSAKRTTLTPDGIVSRSRLQRNLEDIYTTIAITLQREDITRARPEEQAEIVRGALMRQRTLVIVDNLETLDDESVIAFLRELPAPTKAIVTTRERIDVAYAIRLMGMTDREAYKLITQECMKKNVHLDASKIHQLFERTGGVPIAIVWSVALMGLGYGAEEVLNRLSDMSGPVALYCFSQAVGHIKSKPAYKVLTALSIFTTNASREAIEYITGFSRTQIEDGLVELVKLSLVNSFEGRYSLLPLTKSYASNELASDPSKQTISDQYFSYYRELLNSLSSSENLLASKGIALMPERENILGLIEYCKVHNPDGAIELISIFAYFLHYFGYWVELLEQCKYGLLQVRQQDLHKRAIFLSLIGRAQVFQKNFAEAKVNLTEALDLYQELGDVKSSVRTSMYFAYTLEEKDSKVKAREILENALTTSRVHGFDDLIARLQNTLASYDIDEGKFESAKARLQESIPIFESVDKDKARGLAPAYRLMARVEFEQGNPEYTEKLLLKSLEISEATNFSLDMAYSHYRLGIFYDFAQHFNKGINHLAMALDLFTKLGMLEDCENVRQKLSEVQGHIEQW